jgi:type II secretory pathway pseudopilin PulG
MTLLEVMLATAILAMSMAALGQLTFNGVDAALRTKMESEAAIRCRSVINEILSGSLTPTHQTEQHFRDTSDWTWSVSVRPDTIRTMTLMTVTVRHASNPDGTFTIHRLVRPALQPPGIQS